MSVNSGPESENKKGYEDIYLARQPIFDQKMKVWAYELFYRNLKLARNAVFTDELDATLKVLAGLPFCIDLNSINRNVIINFPEKAITEEMHMIYPKETIIVQLTDDALSNNELLDSINQLKQKGYKFSFDNYENNSEQDVVYQLADYITIDVLGKDHAQIELFAKQCKKKFPQCKLIAKRIEEYETYQFTKGLGFHYFQGFFFKKPQTQSGKRISPSSTSKLKIISLLQKKDVKFSEISNALSIDVSIVHRLLVYVNSPIIGLRKKIDSIEEALIVMGLDSLKKWLQIILITDIKPKEKPHELVLLSAQRAYFLELLAVSHTYENKKNQLFLLGLFSLIDVILDQPIEHLLMSLSLEKELEKTLLGKESDFSLWFKIIGYCEQQDWVELDRATNKLGLDSKKLYTLYEEAYHKAALFF